MPEPVYPPYEEEARRFAQTHFQEKNVPAFSPEYSFQTAHAFRQRKDIS